jgi:general secretion pathway protein G
MLQRIREAQKNESGFTLIELLIVIVILGVLAGVVVFAVGAFNSDGVSAACKADKKTLEIASEAFYAKKGSYASGIGAAGDTDTTTLVGGGYIKEPPSTGKYTISYSSSTGAVSSTSC